MAKKENPVFMVRLKPYNPKRGYKLRQYHVFGYRFDERRGWYRVPQFVVDFDHKSGQRQNVDLVAYLRDVKQNNEDMDSKPAFDVCTEAEAAALDEREEQDANRRATAADTVRGRSNHPNDLTTREIRRGTNEEDAAQRRRDRAMSTRSTKVDEPDEEKFDPDEDLGAKS